MEEIEKQLQALGLEEKEAKIYFASLQLGKETAFHIAERSGIKRATTYFILNNLAERGLVTVEKSKKVIHYVPVHPRRLSFHIEHQKKILEDLLPELSVLYNAEPEKPHIQMFEGEAGMKHVYEEIIQSLQEKKEALFFGSVAHMKKYPELIKAWKRETKNKSYKIRELLNNDGFHREYAVGLQENKNLHHEIRLLSKGACSFQNDNAIFGNKLIIFSTEKNLFATVIESSAIVSSYRTMFELAWERAEKL